MGAAAGNYSPVQEVSDTGGLFKSHQQMELRPYQIDNARKVNEILRTYNLAYLTAEVRTGKTATALHAADLYGAKRVLFVTKKKAIASIEYDYAQLKPSYRITVTNYESLHKVKPGEHDLCIFDEAHGLGAFPKPSKRLLDARYLAGQLPVILLSGTPSPESYSQLFHTLSVSAFSPWASYGKHPKYGFHQAFYRWAKAGYVNVRKQRIAGGREIDDYSGADPRRIWPEIKHLFVTFTQEQAGFESQVNEVFYRVDMRPETVRIYRELEKYQVYEKIAGEYRTTATVNSGADLINKLAQISSGTLIFDESDEGTVLDPTKADFIRFTFKGLKIAILYKYKAERELLTHFFPNYTESPEEFNASSDLTFLGQIQSAREGVNLSTADALVMFNIDFSATSYFQARARIQHKDRAVSTVYWIFSTHGIEEKIYQAVSKKKNYTYSYYQKHDRSINSGEDQKGAGAGRVARDPAHTGQHGRLAGSVLLQEWPDLFRGSEAAGKQADKAAAQPTHNHAASRL